MITDRRTDQKQTDYQVPPSSPLATTRLNDLSKKRRSRNWLPFFGAVMIIAGIVIFAATSGITAAKFLLGLWPLFALIAGVAAVMGFAVDRKPRSPVGGMLLLFVGTLFSLARFNSDLNPIALYGRYWILLLGIFAAVELVRYYTHRQGEGKPPKLFGVGRLLIITMIVGSGVVANRLATNDSALASIPLPGFLAEIRDSMIGSNFTFEDAPLTLANIKPGSHVIFTNSYGNVKVSGGATTARATLSQGVRAYKQETAREIADKINLDVKETGSGEYTITTNRGEVKEEYDRQFTTDIAVELPANVSVSISTSYGTVTASKIQNGLQVNTKYGRVETSDITGDVDMTLTSTDMTGSNITGDVTINGGRNVSLKNVTGGVDVEARRGSVDLQKVTGEVKVDAPFSRITAQDLAQDAIFQTERSEKVSVTRAAGVSIEAPHSDVSATRIGGDLKISTDHSDVTMTNVSGNVTVNAEHTNVTADGIQGTASITTTHGEVQLKDFHGGVNIQTSFNDVVLNATSDIAADVIVENSHGDIKAILPTGGNFKIDADADKGKVRTDGFADAPARSREAFTYSSGTGASLITLRTSYNDIRLQLQNVGGRQSVSGSDKVRPDKERADKDNLQKPAPPVGTEKPVAASSTPSSTPPRD